MSTSRQRELLEGADDRILAGRAADGDIRAFEVLVRRFGPMLRVYAMRILGSTDEVDDVVQETFITAWRQLPELTNTAAVKGWLIQIASRKGIDRVRLRARRNAAVLEDADREPTGAPSPHDTVEGSTLQAALSVALSELPEDQRRCWVLREIGDYSYDDIAAQLDLPLSTVRGLLARARRNLAVRMEVWR